ncbi:MAG TPA: hypothetical protein VID47_12835 [Actinomycetota bacterium]|jgi:hypothetical protein
MSFSQRVIWTAIPNGTTSGGDLRVTAYVSPRLMSSSAAIQDLSNWPEWVDWPATLTAASIFVEIGGVAQAANLDPASDPPDSAVWTKLFPSSSPVRPYDFDDRFKGLDARRIRSIPLAPVMDFIQQHYTDVAVGSPTEFPTAADLLPVFVPLSFQSRRTEDLKVQQIEGQLNQTKALGDLGSAQLNFLQAKMFHKVYWQRVPKVDLSPTVEEVDFHQAIGGLNGFPRLLRRLGLAVDLVVPVPAGVGSPTNVHFVLRSGPTGLEAPDTAALLLPVALRFEPRPRSGGQAEVLEGLLRLGDPQYHLLEVDADGAALRIRTFADNLRRSHQSLLHAPDTPGRHGLPALRSGGLGVFRSDNAIHQHALFAAVKGLNAALGTPSAVPFRAEDLLQGLRWDVFDVQSGAWYSLMRRHGAYQIGATSPLTPTIDDEGVASTSVVQDPNAAADDDATDLFLGEILARFTGDSMAAPRPGKTLDTDPAGDPVDTSPLDDPHFHLTETFTPIAGSLPPLRFGRSYRMRARAVFLGATGLGPDDPPPTDFANATDEVVFARFEPVSAPGVVPRSAKTEGEHLDRLVIRSNYNAPSTGPNTRWIVAPKIAQLGAEQHGMLDLNTGLDGTLATYQMIAAREDGSFLRPVLPDPDTGAQPDPNAFDQPFYPVANLHFPVENGGTAGLPYLPDPMSTGAMFRGLPGLAPGTLTKVGFGPGPWPDSDPFILRIEEGSGAPALQGRVMRVQLPKATVAVVLMSSTLRVADLAKMGIWQWILERNPATLSTLQGLAARGLLWMMTPFRLLTLVHAVRQPLKPPLFSPSAGAVKAAIGDTFATIVDKISFSRKSTVQIDLVGEWTDPIDASPSEPRRMVAHHDHAALVDVPVTGTDGFMVFTPTHEFHDTKFHRVTYTMVAKTRFAEYFVQHLSVHLNGVTPALVDANGLVEGQDVVTDPGTGHRYVRGTDYVVHPNAGTIARKAGGSIPNDSDVDVQYLAQPITRDSTEHPPPATKPFIVRNSRRPDPPKVLYAVPLFEWQGHRGPSGVVSRRVGNGLRIFLDRPWWSSGDEEQLGVVFSERPTESLKQWITQWGFDPVYGGVHPAFKVTNALFPLATRFGEGLRLAELSSPLVSVAGHEVDFDTDKRMWFADVRMDVPQSYWPFVRMGLVRFQPFSITDAHLSRVVPADFVRLAPDRTATIVKSTDFSIRITVIGMSYTAVRSVPNPNGDPLTKAGPGTMQVTAQLRDAGVPDATLGWKGLQGPITMGSSTITGGLTRWTADMKFPFKIGTKPLRLVFAEREDFGGGRRRLVYLDTVLLG